MPLKTTGELSEKIAERKNTLSTVTRTTPVESARFEGTCAKIAIELPISLEGDWLYIFEDLTRNPTRTFEDFQFYKKDQKNKKLQMARANKPSEIMYVGTSLNGSIIKRLRQHIVSTANYTYSMKLARWFGDRRVRLYIYKFETAKDNEVIRLIEDINAELLSPAFGRRGAL